MRDRDLYSKILGISAPWHVTDVILDMPAGKVEVVVEHRGEACCPKCGKPCPGYDTRRRRWRHLDTCQFETHLVAEVPRVSCEEHGVVQVSVPWAEGGSRFTALFESLVIDWLKEASPPFTASSTRPPIHATSYSDGMPLHPTLAASLPEIQEACRRAGARALWAFGSATSDRWSPLTSDFDLLIDMPRPLPDLAARFLQLHRDLGRILGRPVDLVSLHGVRNPHFRAELESTRLPIYAAA